MRDAFTIPEFCAAHGFSRTTLYKMPAELWPRVMSIESCRRISREASAEWRELMEHLTALGLSDREAMIAEAVRWRRERAEREIA